MVVVVVVVSAGKAVVGGDGAGLGAGSISSNAHRILTHGLPCLLLRLPSCSAGGPAAALASAQDCRVRRADSGASLRAAELRVFGKLRNCSETSVFSTLPVGLQA